MAARYTQSEYDRLVVNGSVAYDFAALPRDNTAMPLPTPEPRPQPQPQKQPQPVIRQKMAVAPFAVLGMAVALVMMLLVVFSYAELYETSNQVASLQSQVNDLTAESHRLRSQYDSSIDLAAVEQRARELGMQQPSSKQIVTLYIPAEDTTVISQETSSNIFVDSWNAVVETAKSLWEYIAAR